MCFGNISLPKPITVVNIIKHLADLWDWSLTIPSLKCNPDSGLFRGIRFNPSYEAFIENVGSGETATGQLECDL